MKRSRIILMGVVFLSALAFASCGSKKAKEVKEGEMKECCEKKDSTSCEKKCGGENAVADTTKKTE
jgi:hypothetical protein